MVGTGTRDPRTCVESRSVSAPREPQLIDTEDALVALARSLAGAESLALDVEGEHRIKERTDLVGTRHNAAYRLCAAYHDALALVISQDGGTRFMRWRRDAVTYWDQVGVAALDT